MADLTPRFKVSYIAIRRRLHKVGDDLIDNETLSRKEGTEVVEAESAAAAVAQVSDAVVQSIELETSASAGDPEVKPVEFNLVSVQERE